MRSVTGVLSIVHMPCRSLAIRICGKSLAATLVAAAVAGCTQRLQQSEIPPAGTGWRSFEGTWSATGARHALDIAPDRQAAIVELTGSLLLTGERGLGVGFQARAIAFSDGTPNGVGRAVWTDERGDRVFSELRGASLATGNRILGTITGGTGRWNGISGEYGFDWAYVVDDEGRVQGRTVDLRGRARIGPPEGRAP